MRRLPLAAALAALVLGPPARAANKDLERLYFQIAALQAQVTELKALLEESARETRRLNESVAEQTAQIRKLTQDARLQDEAVHTTLRELAEKVAVLGERLEAQRLAAARAEVAAPPLAAPAASPAPSGPPTTMPAAPAPGAPPPRELYSQAYADYARGNFDLAIQGYREYLRHYPNTDFSDNAQYWIGECLYSKQRYSESLEAWEELFRTYPSSDKLPDAYLKKGMALERLGRRAEALQEFRRVAERYPATEAARKARERLSAP